MSYTTKQTAEKVDRGHVSGKSGRGRSFVAVAVNHFEDVHHGSSVPPMGSVTDTVETSIAGEYSFAGAAGKILVTPYTGSETLETMRVSWLLRFSAVDADSTLTLHLLDADFTSLHSAEVLGDLAVTEGYYWYTANLDAGLVGEGVFYLGLELPSGTVAAIPYYTVTGTDLETVESGSATTAQADAKPVYLSAHVYGKTAPVQRLDGIEVDVLTLGVK